MARVSFSAEAFENANYNLTPLKLENWFAEEISERDDWTHRLIPTPGLTVFDDTGGTLARGCTQSDAIASGQILKAVDAAIYRVNSSGVATQITGAIQNDSLPVRFALSQAEAVANSGGKVYTVTASTVSEFTSALTSAGASGAIIDVAVLNNRHIYIEDNSGRAFYSDPGDASTISGFVTAESDPDQLKAAIVSGGSLLLFGTKKTEFWTGTSSVTTPLIPRQGYVLDVGIIATDAKCLAGSNVIWVGNDGVVYVWNGGREQRISAHWMERSISALSAANKALIRCTAHDWQGHTFAKVYIPTVGDFFFDTLTGRWHRRRGLTDTAVPWDYDFFVESFGNTYVMKLDDGKLYSLSGQVFTEAGASVRRVAQVGVPLSQSVQVSNMVIEGTAGVGLDGTTGQGSDPKCMLRVAIDGHTFRGPITRSIGKHGEHRWRPVYGPQGQFKPPMGVVEISYTDPVGWILYGITYNERAW